MATIIQIKTPDKNITQPDKSVEKWNICLFITHIII